LANKKRNKAMKNIKKNKDFKAITLTLNSNEVGFLVKVVSNGQLNKELRNDDKYQLLRFGGLPAGEYQLSTPKKHDMYKGLADVVLADKRIPNHTKIIRKIGDRPISFKQFKNI
jgi:hypothetical protein